MDAEINTLYDFNRIRDGELLQPLAGAKAPGDFDPRAFAWSPAGPGVAIIGSITTVQESMPCAYVSVWALRDGECFYAYDTITRCRAQCTMWWRLDDGSWRTARYCEDRCQSCGADLGPPPPPAEQRLMCEDGAGLFAGAAAPPGPWPGALASEVAEPQ